MDDLDITESALPDGIDIVPADSDSTSTEPALTLSEINAHLGKNFPTKEAALKALKDTSVFAVTKEEKIAERIRASLNTGDNGSMAQELAQIKESMFYKDNPEYADYRETIKALGKNPSEVIDSPAFKQIYGDAKTGKEFKNTRTVLESNPRITEAKSSLERASEAMNAGRTDQAKELAAQAVADAFGLR